MRLARVLPKALRRYIQNTMERLQAPPARMVFPCVGKQETLPIRVILYGIAWPEWTTALGNANLWKEIAGVREVLRIPDSPKARKPRPVFPQNRTVVIPLAEDHIKNCPRDYLSLIPDDLSIDTLRNKASFALYIKKHGLAYLCPTTYETVEDAVFPCVLKRVDLYGGIGIEIIKSPCHLQSLLKQEIWQGKDFVLQSFIPGTTEYVTHCVCRDGRILWNASFSYEKNSSDEIRKGSGLNKMHPYTASSHIISQIEKILFPLRYTGPCNVNYKFSSTGEIAIFEINPRFGGSLMMPQNNIHLRDALSCIVKNARSASA